MTHPARMPSPFAAGFTLIELLVTLVVGVLLLTIGVPSFQGIIAQNRAASSANELLTSLQFARSEAVRLRTDAVLCPSTDGENCTGGDDWDDGWIVRIGTDVRRVGPALHPTVSVSGPEELTYGSAGQVTPSGTPFELSVAFGGGVDRFICLEASGRAQVLQESCT